MKSCIEWRKSFKYLPQIDQFNIDFKNKEIQLKKFLDTYAKSQRVNIRLPEEYTKDDVDLLEVIYQKGYNIAIILPDLYYVNQFKEHNIPFFLSQMATSWDEFRGICSLGVSDVYITNELGFCLDRVSFIAKLNNINIRCFANIAQSSWRNGDGFKDFYIRPEDMDYYSEFVDVIQFYDSVEQQNMLYEIYFKDKEWNGKLREIIKRLSSDINNYYILGPEFANRRMRCEKKCLKGNRCRLCNVLNDLANGLEESENYEVYKRR